MVRHVCEKEGSEFKKKDRECKLCLDVIDMYSYVDVWIRCDMTYNKYISRDSSLVAFSLQTSVQVGVGTLRGAT